MPAFSQTGCDPNTSYCGGSTNSGQQLQLPSLQSGAVPGSTSQQNPYETGGGGRGRRNVQRPCAVDGPAGGAELSRQPERAGRPYGSLRRAHVSALLPALLRAGSSDGIPAPGLFVGGPDAAHLWSEALSPESQHLCAGRPGAGNVELRGGPGRSVADPRLGPDEFQFRGDGGPRRDGLHPACGRNSRGRRSLRGRAADGQRRHRADLQEFRSVGEPGTTSPDPHLCHRAGEIPRQLHGELAQHAGERNVCHGRSGAAGFDAAHPVTPQWNDDHGL